MVVKYCGGLNLKNAFAAILLVTTGSVVLMAFRVLQMPRFFAVSKIAIGNTTEMDMVVRDHRFAMRGTDVMVFLHIQKTGGSKFGTQLVNNLDIKRPCVCSRKKSHDLRKYAAKQKTKVRKVCSCFRPGSKKIWLFSRHHLGWPCGLHADWTEHHECVPKYMNKREGRNVRRKFVYITIVREAISRFLSEFAFVQNLGEMWRAASLRCNGRSPTQKELPSCFTRDDLSDVTLEEFLGCPWNLAFNRQTRMLADLRLVNCYNTSGKSPTERGRLMLESAKRNLQKMPFFGLTEYQEASQYLFEKTFGLKFVTPFTQLPEDETRAGNLLPILDSSVLSQIKTLNSLDIELYTFAKNVFFKRLAHFKGADRIRMEQETE